MATPQLAIPRGDLIGTPIDAVQAALTVLISARCGVSVVTSGADSDEADFFENAFEFIKRGDKTFAEKMSEAAHDLEREGGAEGVQLSFALAFAVAAEAGVHHRMGKNSSAWQRAAYASLLFGVCAGAEVHNKGSLRDVMATLSGKASEARMAKSRRLRDFALERYRAKKWPSANAAAHYLQGEIMRHAESIGARLSKTNAQRTIAQWFREADRDVQEG